MGKRYNPDPYRNGGPLGSANGTVDIKKGGGVFGSPLRFRPTGMKRLVRALIIIGFILMALAAVVAVFAD